MSAEKSNNSAPKFRTKYEGIKFAYGDETFGEAAGSVAEQSRSARKSINAAEGLVAKGKNNFKIDKRFPEEIADHEATLENTLEGMHSDLMNFKPLEGKMKVYSSKSPKGKHLNQMFGENAYMVTLKDYRFASTEYENQVLKKMVFFVVLDPQSATYKGYTEDMKPFSSNNVEELVDLAAETHSKIATAHPRTDILKNDPISHEESDNSKESEQIADLSQKFESFAKTEKGITFTKQYKKGNTTPQYMLRLKNYQFTNTAGAQYRVKDSYFFVELDLENNEYKSYFRGGLIHGQTPEELVYIAADLATQYQ